MTLSPPRLALAAVLGGLLALLPSAAESTRGDEKPQPNFPAFAMQEIDHSLGVGYAVLLTDVDGDKKPDIVVVDQHKVAWYENPGRPGAEWKKRIILNGKTRLDNVCAVAVDVDGDGLPEGSEVRPDRIIARLGELLVEEGLSSRA